VDCGWLAEHGVRVSGSVGVYELDSSAAIIDWQPAIPLSGLDLVDGTALYGEEVDSWPPIEAVCIYGGDPVDEWLGSLRLTREDYDHAAGTAEGKLYQKEYRRRSPLYGTKYSAVLGGWHAMWSDDDFYIPREMHLALWTLRSEPYIDVFERAPNLVTRVRRT
jgi:hypothetical protein